MIEYLYKGFKLSYKIATTTKPSYQAYGSLTYLLNNSDFFVPRIFEAEKETHSAAEYEIKTLLEEHANVALKNFYAQKEIVQ